MRFHTCWELKVSFLVLDRQERATWKKVLMSCWPISSNSKVFIVENWNIYAIRKPRAISVNYRSIIVQVIYLVCRNCNRLKLQLIEWATGGKCIGWKCMCWNGIRLNDLALSLEFVEKENPHLIVENTKLLGIVSGRLRCEELVHFAL